MRIFGFNITFGPAPKQSQDSARLLDLLEENLREKDEQSKLHREEKQKLKQELAIAKEQQRTKKEKSKVRHAKTALVHLLAAERLNNMLEIAEFDEVRDAQYNLAILERTIAAKNLGVEVKDKNITEAIAKAESIINGN